MTAAALRALQSARGDSAFAEAAAALLDAMYPGGGKSPSHHPQWPLCRRLTPHVRALWATGAAPHTAAMDTLLNQSALYLGAMADHAAAVDLARASLDLKRARLPDAHRDVALAHANLGNELRANGDLTGAATELAEAVRLGEQHRPGSEDLAASYTLHGRLLFDIGHDGDRAALLRAQRRYLQAYAIHRGNSRRDTDPVAETLNALGAARSALGHSRSALCLYRASLAIRQRIVASDDARLGAGHLNVGGMLLRLGHADAAEDHLRQAFHIRRAAYADRPHHPETRNATGWLANCLLVRARAGEDAGARRAEARRLCGEFGLDLAAAERAAEATPYTPGAGGGAA